MPILMCQTQPKKLKIYRRYKWASWEIELLNQLKQEKLSDETLARRFGVPKRELTRTLRKNKLRVTNNWAELKDDLQRELDRGLTPYELADLFETSEPTINLQIRRLNLKRPKTHAKRAKNPNSKWQCRKPEILQLLAEGKSVRDLAEFYQVPLGRVYAALFRMQISYQKSRPGRKPLPKTPGRKHNCEQPSGNP